MSKSHRQQFEEALACETPEQASGWLESEIQRFLNDYPERYPNTADGMKNAKKTILSNLGYMAGYYNSETAHRIYKLFGAVHPIFGTATYFKDITPEQAFRMGQDWAKKE